jgi:nucleoid DNA-binding protein
MPRVATGYRTASKAAFEHFKTSHPEIKINKQKWTEIIYQFNEGFRDYILETGSVEKLPWGFGPLTINKKKRKTTKTLSTGKTYINLPIDWKKSKEKNKIIYNFNYDTDGYFFGWKWFRKQARFKMSDYWYFKPSRVSSRMIAHYIKSDKNQQHKYLEWK